jgi:aryl-alcohol dehydrogenase-like predicted oxidoreductase
MSIPTTRLGRTGLTVSRLALGTMTFGLQTDEAVSHQILERAAEGGINFLDTADVYPLGGTVDTAGRTEEIIGRWLRAKGASRRHDFIIATKAANKVGPHSWDQGNSRKHLLDAIDASLKRLQTDHVDLYQLHARVVPATSASRISWLTGWPARSAAPSCAGSPSWSACSRATACCSARSSASCCRWPARKAWA